MTNSELSQALHKRYGVDIQVEQVRFSWSSSCDELVADIDLISRTPITNEMREYARYVLARKYFNEHNH